MAADVLDRVFGTDIVPMHRPFMQIFRVSRLKAAMGPEGGPDAVLLPNGRWRELRTYEHLLFDVLESTSRPYEARKSRVLPQHSQLQLACMLARS